MKVKFLRVIESKSGTSNAGNPWNRVGFLADTGQKYDPEVYFQASGEVAHKIERLRPGQEVEIQYALKSREYNGRYYTDVNVYSIANNLDQEGLPPVGGATVPPAQSEPNWNGGSDQNDDLPF